MPKIVFILLCYSLTLNAQSVLISSFRTARTFLHNSGDPIYLSNMSDLWRICPPPLDASHCSPALQKTASCAVIDPGCRCYNWQLEETPSIIEHHKCVFINIPQPNPITNITWKLAWTYPVAPPGYHLYAKILYNRLITKSMPFATYFSTLLPLLCNEARIQSFGPILDNCQFMHTLNFSYIPEVSLHVEKTTTVGRAFLVVIALTAASIFALLSFHHQPKIKKT